MKMGKKMKKLTAAILSGAMAASLTACGGTADKADNAAKPAADTGSEAAGAAQTQGGVELEVVTTFAGNDGNAKTYKKFYQMWEEKTGNTVEDMSATSDDTFKVRVVTDFETGSEPDVLFSSTAQTQTTSLRQEKWYPSRTSGRNIPTMLPIWTTGAFRNRGWTTRHMPFR